MVLRPSLAPFIERSTRCFFSFVRSVIACEQKVWSVNRNEKTVGRMRAEMGVVNGRLPVPLLLHAQRFRLSLHLRRLV